ncbi:transcription antitermination factor NusB, partial [Acinetobacter baumannii]
YLSIPEHASINETVKVVHDLKKTWAKNFVNAVLRNFQRNRAHLLAKLDEDLTSQYAHPLWLIEKIREDWPFHWQAILNANN